MLTRDAHLLLNAGYLLPHTVGRALYYKKLCRQAEFLFLKNRVSQLSKTRFFSYKLINGYFVKDFFTLFYNNIAFFKIILCYHGNSICNLLVVNANAALFNQASSLAL